MVWDFYIFGVLYGVGLFVGILRFIIIIFINKLVKFSDLIINNWLEG